jgi:hypothetical protein
MGTLRTAKRISLCVLAAAAVVSCSGPMVTAVGDSDDLLVICDRDAKSVADLTVGTFEAGQDWLLGEPLFETTLTTPEESGELRNRRHIVIVGVRGGDAARMASRVFPDLRSEGPPELRLTQDVWADRQVVGVILADDESELTAFLRENAQDLRTGLADAAVARLAEGLIEDAEESGMKASMEERFGWSISPPTGYEFFTTNVDDGFVFFRRTGPDRTIFLYWTEGTPESVTESYATTIREKVAGAYFDGDTIEQERPMLSEDIEFLERPAVRLSGWWANRTLVGGGPFRSYCFYDAPSGRLYLLDISLFAPGYDKTSLMRNLDAIAHTLVIR